MSELYEALHVLITPSQRGVCMALCGDVDLAAVELLRDGLAAAVASGSGDVDIDMSATTFCDSVGLCAILVARRQLFDHGRRLRIVNATPPVLRLLDLSGTRHLLTDPPVGSPP